MKTCILLAVKTVEPQKPLQHPTVVRIITMAVFLSADHQSYRMRVERLKSAARYRGWGIVES